MSSASTTEWAARLRTLVPGCADFTRCGSCAAWATAADAVAAVPPSPAARRTAFLRQAITVCQRAGTVGFYPHQARHKVDAVEEGSLDPAPDDEQLLAALARAQAAVDAHAEADMSGLRVPPPGAFTGAVLWPEGLRPRTPPRHVTSVDSWDVAGVEALARTIADDLASGALVISRPIASTTAFIASPDAKPRVCVNLRPVNELMAPSTVTYPTPRDLALCGRGWFVKIDLKAAFKRVGVPPAAQGWLGFEVAGIGLTYHALPFGWAWSPEIFSAALAPVVDEIRTLGVVLVAYVDDFAIAGRTPAEAVDGATVALRVLRSHGWIVAPAKAFLRPVRGLRFLGVVVRGGAQPALALLPATADKLGVALERAVTRRCFRDVVRIWGLTSFAASVWPHLALARAGLDDVAAATIASQGDLCRTAATVADVDWAAVVTIASHAVASVAAAVEAGWHRCYLPARLSAPLRIASDASAWAVGAVMAVGGVLLVTSRALEQDELRLPSSVRELLAIEHAVEHWAPILAAPPYRRVLLSTDATAAAAGVGSWSSASPAGVEVLRRLWVRLNAIRAVDRFEVEWRPREDPAQQEADAASRLAPPVRPPLVPGGTPGALACRIARMCLAVFGTDRGLRHEGAVEGYILAPAYTASLSLEPARVRQRRRFLGWPGSVPYAGDDIVIIHPTGAADWERTALLVDAAHAAEIAGLVVVATSCAVSRVPLMADRWARMRTRFLLADRGDAVRLPDVTGGGWVDGYAWTQWFAYLFSATGARLLGPPAGRDAIDTGSAGEQPRYADPEAGSHRPDPAHILCAEWCAAQASAKQRREAGDIHPHPGPPRRNLRWDIDGAWGRSLAADGVAAGSVGDSGLASTAQASAAEEPARAVAGPHAAVAGPAGAADGSASPPSVGRVLEALRTRTVDGAATLLLSYSLPPALAEVLVLGIADADADRAPSTQARADRVATELVATAAAAGATDVPWSPIVLDALAVSWIRSRLGLAPTVAGLALPGGSTPAPATLAADLGALAARARRRFPHGIAGRAWPATGLGPVAKALLDARGAGVRHEASPKRPIWGWELRWGLRNHAEVAAEEPVAVATILVIGASMWRSVYVRTLPASGLTLVAPGVLTLVWTGPHKTNRHVGKPGVPSASRWGFVTAGWVVDFVVEKLGLSAAAGTAPRAGPAFPSRTHPASPCSWEKLTTVLRRLLSGLPHAEAATLHGLRVGHDSEARLAGVPDVVRDSMGWWKRARRRMSEHYEALDVAELLDAGRRYGDLIVNAVAPGLARVSGTWPNATAPYASPLMVQHGRLEAVFGTPTRSLPGHTVGVPASPTRPPGAAPTGASRAGSRDRIGAPARAGSVAVGPPGGRVPRLPREMVDVESSATSADGSGSGSDSHLPHRARGGLDTETLRRLVAEALDAARPALPSVVSDTGRVASAVEESLAPGPAAGHR